MSQKEDPERDLASKINDVDLLFPKRYIRGADLQGRDVTLTISRIATRTLRKADGTTEDKAVLHFEEMQRRPADERKLFVVSARCNANSIAAATGERNPHKWPGHRITLYPFPWHDGSHVIRVRDKAPAPKAAPAGENGTRKKYLTALDEETIRVEVGEELARRGVGSLAECSTEQLKDIYATVTAENPLA